MPNQYYYHHNHRDHHHRHHRHRRRRHRHHRHRHRRRRRRRRHRHHHHHHHLLHLQSLSQKHLRIMKYAKFFQKCEIIFLFRTFQFLCLTLMIDTEYMNINVSSSHIVIITLSIIPTRLWSPAPNVERKDPTVITHGLGQAR